MKIIKGLGVTAARGFTAAGVAAGLKNSGKKDLALIYSARPAVTAAAFTTNEVSAAPVAVCRQILSKHERAQAVVVNSGNANACTGAAGLADAWSMSKAATAELRLASPALVASTGIIGRRLPLAKVESGIKKAAALLSETGGAAAAEAILTTDAFKKAAAVEFSLGGKVVRLGAMAKGAGMIAPRLVPHATTIAVVTTDAAVAPPVLRRILGRAVNETFNVISVDGDTSTNDTIFILANGAAGHPRVESAARPEADKLLEALTTVLLSLAKMIVRDGEGATKLIHYRVRGGADKAAALKVARAIAESLLVKTAFFGADPNWGRVLAAAGRAGVPLAREKMELFFGTVKVVEAGRGVRADTAALRRIMAAEEITVTLNLNQGEAAADFYGCDLSYDYVKLNAEYHT